MKTIKELEEQIRELKIAKTCLIILFVFLFCLLMVCIILYDIQIDSFETQLSECQEQVPITCENLPRMISDSCAIGCIYSTKFYYNNSEINLEAECMMYCLSKSYEISNQICGVME